MCFSATVSFGAAAVLAGVGVVSVHQTRSCEQRPLAAIPLLVRGMQIPPSMSRSTCLLFATAAALGAAGCDATDDDETPEPVSAREQLAAPLKFHVAPAETKVSLRATLDRGESTDETNASMAVTLGQLDLSADQAGDLILDDFTLAFEEVPLPTDIYPGDLALTDVHLHFATPVACAATLWAADDEAAFCSATAELTLDWKLLLGGKVHPMASQTLSGLELDVEVVRDEGRLRLDLTAHADGILWSWSDIAGLSDLWLWIRGYDRSDAALDF